MTGPEHYLEAERLLGVDKLGPGHSKDVAALDSAARAQVHATLALVMAIADPLGYGGRGDDQWTDLTG